MTIRPKYHQGTPKEKWKIQQCKGEKVYFGFNKDCGSCKGKFHCETVRIRLFGVEVHDEVLVFGETKEDAKEYALKRHGQSSPRYRGIDSVIPYKVKIEGNQISFKIDFDSP
jgi:hypothetical protein